VLKAKQFMGEHLPAPAAASDDADSSPEAELAAAHPSVFHPLHTIRPEVE